MNLADIVHCCILRTLYQCMTHSRYSINVCKNNNWTLVWKVLQTPTSTPSWPPLCPTPKVPEPSPWKFTGSWDPLANHDCNLETLFCRHTSRSSQGKWGKHNWNVMKRVLRRVAWWIRFSPILTSGYFPLQSPRRYPKHSIPFSVSVFGINFYS